APTSGPGRGRATEGGLPAVDLIALYALQVHDGLTAGMVARLLHLQQSSITGLADRLERSGLIARARDREDRRRVWLCLTDEGRDLLHRCGTRIRLSVRDRFASLTPDRAAEMAGLLSSVVEPWLTDIVAPGAGR
ncbi:MarR family winged helix-turn-helix transcriptional regulator, partial [Actinoplanes philippinensis]|uniref:MarR family winged helix-turn-helix transcriptional regulator n=1 Tax=Actinoplanes philippinensis TaxID=35752 RepID=UPI0033E2F4B8